MTTLGVNRLEDPMTRQRSERFGIYHEDQPTLFVIKISLILNDGDIGSWNPMGFYVHFYVIEGDLPFLLEFPSFTSIETPISLKHMTLSFSFTGKYCRMHL